MHVAPHSWRRSAVVLAPVCEVFGASLLKPFRPAPPYALHGRFAERVCRVSADLRRRSHHKPQKPPQAPQKTPNASSANFIIFVPVIEELKQRILREGRAKAEGGIVMVGSFLNHQLDPQLMMTPRSSPACSKTWVSTRLSPSRLPGRQFPGTGVSFPPQTPERSTSRRLWCGSRVRVREGSGRPLQRSMASTGPCSPSSSGSTSAATGSSPRLKTAR